MSDYDVGYGKPPKAHRYKKGQSGNPKGRPKPAIGNSICEDIQEEFEALVTVSEGGNVKKITKQKLFVKSLIKKASEGNPHALKQLNHFTDSFKPALFGGPQVSFRMTSTAMDLIEKIEREVLGRDADDTSGRISLDNKYGKSD